ncbi:uncharacterized protein [Paramisgurnus dabryanus]|uniref:uncharacterized protein n=1 Tax=Paramisgurnus dabryanus TaxID=90735 RepID=UPI0031F41674
MDLNICIVLLCTLFAGGRSLKCNECIDVTGSCVSKETTCSSAANTCASTRVVTTTGETTSILQTKSCNVIQNCRNVSFNFGVLRTKLSMECCNTDLCNSINVPDYISDSPNGKQCYYCDGKSCLNTLNCLGDEDYCITATTNITSLSTTVKGCTTKSICDDVSQAPSGFMGLSCCQGNLCNGVRSVTQTYGRSLKCNECIGVTGSCVSKETTCSSAANTCASATVVTTNGDTSVTMEAKTCDVIQSCGNGSLNFGVFRSKVSMQCCNTDLCNSINVPDYISNSANGKQCYYCDGKNCLNTLNCLGDEDYCITATTNITSLSTTVKGCTTKSICDEVSQAPPGFMDLSCCQENLCNVVKSVTQTYGRALKCNECIGVTGSCVSKETTCSSAANTCASATVVTTIGDTSVTMEAKTCDVIQSCGNGSFNVGVFRSKVSMQCCNTDLCNSINVPDYISNSGNGKKCYFCDGKSCWNTLNCLGNEDYCIKATTNITSLPTTVKGCTTKSICDDVSQAPSGFMGLSCCQGDLCNGAKSITQNLLFLSWPLFFYILIH